MKVFVTFDANWKKLVLWYVKSLNFANIFCIVFKVKLNTFVKAEDLAGNYDDVVIATGVTPRDVKFEGCAC